MSYFAEVTRTECVNRMIAIKDSVQERSQNEIKVLASLPSAIDEYLARGGTVTELPPMAMEDPQSDESVQRRKDMLRQYDYSREMKELKANKRTGKC